MVWVLLTIYVLSALAAAAINWADYRDRISYYQTERKEKVIKLYIVPLTPVVNTAVVAGAMMEYFN